MGAKEEHKITDTTIIRLEQLYPLPYKQIDKIIENIRMLNYSGYKKNQQIWVLGLIS